MNDLLELAQKIVAGLRDRNHEAVVVTRPPGIEIVVSEQYTLRRRLDESDLEAPVNPVKRLTWELLDAANALRRQLI